MSKLKVYGWIGQRREYDSRGHHQTREIVAASSQAEAARLAGAGGPWQLNNLSITGNEHEVALALSKPGAVFWKGLDEYPELGRGTWREAAGQP